MTLECSEKSQGVELQKAIGTLDVVKGMGLMVDRQAGRTRMICQNNLVTEMLSSSVVCFPVPS